MSVSSKEIIDQYINHAELFKGFEEFGLDNRKKYSLSFYGRAIQKIKVYFFLIFIEKPGSSLSKYIFEHQNERYLYKNFIELLEPADCSVIGGLSNLFRTTKSKHGFIWGGGIIAAFEIALHLGNYKYLDKIIHRLNLWNDECNEIVIFLHEDTQPLGLVLSSVFKKSDNISTVCIAHGFFPETDDGLTFEGNNCNFNFIWDKSQEKFFDKEKTSVILLGLPYEYSVINKVDKNNIILVGHYTNPSELGSSKDLFESLLTYAHMFFVYNRLKENDYCVKFKKHPQDNSLYARKFFGEDISTDLNREMRKGSIIVGFASSALYDAKMRGLHVIGLDTELLSYKRSFEVDKSFKASEYKNIPHYLNSLSTQINKAIEPESLAKRFSNAMSVIQLNQGI